MITAIVFSKDRACQLHLLLESIKRNCPDLFHIRIMWTASNEKFDKGYQKLLNEGQNLPTFLHTPQGDVDSETHSFKKLCQHMVKTSNPLLTFFCDDDIIYRTVDVTEDEVAGAFENCPQLSTISLRLGKNTGYQYLSSDGTNQCPPPQQIYELDKFLLWDHRTLPSHTNFGYPLSVEGHIFKKEFMESIMEKDNFDFYDPNSLEHLMQQFLGIMQPLMGCREQNYIVNTPVNRVQDTFLNRAGDTFGVTAEELNDKYLEGYTINLDAIDFSNIVGCQQELELPLHKLVMGEATVKNHG